MIIPSLVTLCSTSVTVPTSRTYITRMVGYREQAEAGERSERKDPRGVVTADRAQPGRAEAGALECRQGVGVGVGDVREVGPEQHPVPEVAQPAKLSARERAPRPLDERRERHRRVEQQ